MNKLVFGKYIPIDSPIHRLDPRTKLIALFIIIIAIFIPSSWWCYLFLGIILLTVVFMSGLKLSFVLRTFKPMMFMMIFLLIINIFSVKSGFILLSIGNFAIYSDAIFNTLFIRNFINVDSYYITILCYRNSFWNWWLCWIISSLFLVSFCMI